MVQVHTEKKELLFRVVYLGTTEATKFSTIRDLQQGFEDRGAGNLTVMHAGGDRIVGFRYIDPSAEEISGHRCVYEVMTIPGESKTPSNEQLLTESADAMVWLDDRGGKGAGTERLSEAWRMASQGRPADQKPSLHVQCYADDDCDRAPLYKEGLDGQAVRVRRVEGGPDGPRGLFAEVCENLRQDMSQRFERDGEKAFQALPSKRAVLDRARSLAFRRPLRLLASTQRKLSERIQDRDQRNHSSSLRSPIVLSALLATGAALAAYMVSRAL